MYLDEAHAIGALGPEGRGIAASSAKFNNRKKKSIVMGTLTKAVSMMGGYVVMEDENLCALMRTFSPHYIFSAPIPPWMAEATSNVLNVIKGPYGDGEREKLKFISRLMHQSLENNGFIVLNGDSHIISVHVGSIEDPTALQNYLGDQGFLVSLFTYPAVPKNSALLRLSLCSDITEEEIDMLINRLVEAREKFKF